ncbi:MAG TPA: hypothetical protein VFY16_13715 [Gemmatimonadaceae bacterium]|nr:hypothetical protein [Gemmatimonadaceae bacterium]
MVIARSSSVRALGALALLLSVGGCASTGATSRSGVGDSWLERPPYYAGRAVTGDSARVARLPVTYQRGAAQAPIFEPAAGAEMPIGQLLGEMNAYLDSLSAGVELASLAALPGGTPPDVSFGCATDASGDCVELTDEESGAATEQGLRLAVGRPSGAWVAATAAALDRAGATRALLLTLEVGQYRVTSTGWRNDKSVELGTGYAVKLPWLTSLDAPVQVLQLTGVLVERDGRAVRIGAEGLLARRSNLLTSGFGAQALVTDEDVARLRIARRDDLPGRPLVWQVALETLVRQLTGRAAA